MFINNTAQISGSVTSAPHLSHSIYDEDFFTFMLAVPRLSGTVDTLPVIAAGATLSFFPISVGDDVCAYGQLRSYNRLVEGKSRLDLRLFARRLTTGIDAVNDICLNGWLCKKPIYRTTPFGREIADLLLAVNRQFNKSDYIPVIAWGRSAQYAAALDVGTKVIISGRLQSRDYEKQQPDGTCEKRTTYEVSAASIKVDEL